MKHPCSFVVGLLCIWLFSFPSQFLIKCVYLILLILVITLFFQTASASGKSWFLETLKFNFVSEKLNLALSKALLSQKRGMQRCFNDANCFPKRFLDEMRLAYAIQNF